MQVKTILKKFGSSSNKETQTYSCDLSNSVPTYTYPREPFSTHAYTKQHMNACSMFILHGQMVETGHMSVSEWKTQTNMT